MIMSIVYFGKNQAVCLINFHYSIVDVHQMIRKESNTEITLESQRFITLKFKGNIKKLSFSNGLI